MRRKTLTKIRRVLSDRLPGVRVGASSSGQVWPFVRFCEVVLIGLKMLVCRNRVTRRRPEGANRRRQPKQQRDTRIVSSLLL